MEFSPRGAKIVVGLGGRLGAKSATGEHDGTILLLNAETLVEEARVTDSKKWISDVKFSPDGSTIAVASHDSHIYLYDVEKCGGAAWGLTLRATCVGHSSAVLHVDFSRDGASIQSNSSGYELLYWDADTVRVSLH